MMARSGIFEGASCVVGRNGRLLSQSTLEMLPIIRSVCADAPVIQKLYLFGSRARGIDNPCSDYDFYGILDLRHPDLAHRYLDAIERLESAVGGSVDFVVDGYWSDRDGVLRSEIERDKVLIYNRDA